ARLVQEVSERLLSRTGAVLYQVTMALTLGGLIGTLAALVLYGEKSLEILVGGVGGIAVVASLLRWVVAAVPDLDDPHALLAAKRRVFILSFAATLAVFFGHRWAIKHDIPLIPLGADTEIAQRISGLEDELAQLRGELGLRPFRRQFQSALPWTRSWFKIPAEPSRYYDVRLEMVDPYRRARLEVIVTDSKGTILGGRRFRDDRSGSLIVRATDEWALHVGIRWWPQDASPVATEALALVGAGGRAPGLAPADLQVTALEIVNPHGERQRYAGTVTDLKFDDKGAVSHSLADAAPTRALKSRCGGQRSLERVFSIDVPELGWVRLTGETALDQPALISAYAGDGDDGDDGTRVLHEIACDGSAAPAERDTNTLASELELLLPAGALEVALDGFTDADASYSLRGAFRPLQIDPKRPEVFTVAPGAESGRLVDLLRADPEAPCGSESARIYDLEIRAPADLAGAPDVVITATLGPLSGRDRASDGSLIPHRGFDRSEPQLLWRPANFSTDPHREGGCDLDRASFQATATIPAGESRTLQILAPLALAPDIQALSLRVQHPATEALKAACEAAIPLDLPPMGAYASATGTVLSQRVDAFAISECRPGGLFQPPVDLDALEPRPAPGAPGRREPDRSGEADARRTQAVLDLPLGSSTREVFWQVKLPDKAVLNALVVPAGEVDSRYYVTVLRGCGEEPQILACRTASPPEKARVAITLPAGEYTVVVDGEPGRYLLAYGTDPIDPVGAALVDDP
ncbi:MAG: hypothetical protein R3B09_33755, partial [Nannocystaceae bacterium]